MRLKAYKIAYGGRLNIILVRYQMAIAGVNYKRESNNNVSDNFHC